jgi:hypothetical protein
MDYTRYLKNKNVNLNKKISIPKFCRLEIETKKFIDFAKTHKPIRKWHHPRSFLTKQANEQMSMNNALGYNRHNTMESNWGLGASQNEKLLDILGSKNIKKLKIDPDKILCRLLKYDPGQTLPLHTDGFEGFSRKFGSNGVPVRYFVSVSDWDWGHMLQVHNNTISNWKAGDTYIIPPGIFHASANFGITPKYTLTITGFVI